MMPAPGSFQLGEWPWHALPPIQSFIYLLFHLPLPWHRWSTSTHLTYHIIFVHFLWQPPLVFSSHDHTISLHFSLLTLYSTPHPHYLFCHSKPSIHSCIIHTLHYCHSSSCCHIVHFNCQPLRLLCLFPYPRFTTIRARTSQQFNPRRLAPLPYMHLQSW